VTEMEYVLDCINKNKMPFDGDDFHEALRLGRQAIEQAQKQEPVERVDTDPIDLQLYPPQRQPLTRDEYEHMLGLMVVPPQHLEMVVRTIEAAHGIKGET
jgi:hypothetical protein